jgi:hypothetical protein
MTEHYQPHYVEPIVVTPAQPHFETRHASLSRCAACAQECLRRRLRDSFAHL